MDSIEIHSLTPSKGVNSYRMGDSDDLVMVDKFKYFPPGKSFNGEHGIFSFAPEVWFSLNMMAIP